MAFGAGQLEGTIRLGRTLDDFWVVSMERLKRGRCVRVEHGKGG